MTKLSGKEIQDLSKLLLTTLSEDDLETIVYSSTGDRLYEVYVGPGQPLLPTIRDLLIELSKLGTESIFLSEVHKRRPDRPDVQKEIERLVPESVSLPQDGGAALAVQLGGKVQADEPNDAFSPGLQRNVKPYLHKVDVMVWRQKLGEIERRVCRIERAGNSLGTGFLVGPDTVLTNWHVAEAAQKAGKLAELTCLFDYQRLADGGRQPGVPVAVLADGCLDSSPYSAAEMTQAPKTPPPSPDELDYALLRLARAIGGESANGTARGWIALPQAAETLAAGSPLLIVQHPDGAPMKLALDTEAVIGFNANGTRLEYRTNTDPGSSGSPCFTMDWDLVALHHYGDPAWQQPLYNQGVPAMMIRQRIAAKGQAAALGA